MKKLRALQNFVKSWNTYAKTMAINEEKPCLEFLTSKTQHPGFKNLIHHFFPSSLLEEEVEVADGAKFDAYLQILFLDFPRERPIWNIKIKFPFSFYPHSFSFFEKQN